MKKSEVIKQIKAGMKQARKDIIKARKNDDPEYYEIATKRMAGLDLSMQFVESITNLK